MNLKGILRATGGNESEFELGQFTKLNVASKPKFIPHFFWRWMLRQVLVVKVRPPPYHINCRCAPIEIEKPGWIDDFIKWFEEV